MLEELWPAIVNSDEAYDGQFFYAVETTRIFCRPSCKSRLPKPENVRIFRSPEEALAAHFRPCKRCRPDHIREPRVDFVNQAVQFIKQHYPDPITLTTMAQALYISPYYLHRIFSRVLGMTPAEYVRQVRLETAQRLLKESNMRVTDVAGSVGFLNRAHFATAFRTRMGMSPTMYRHRVRVENLAKED